MTKIRECIADALRYTTERGEPNEFGADLVLRKLDEAGYKVVTK